MFNFSSAQNSYNQTRSEIIKNNIIWKIKYTFSIRYKPQNHYTKDLSASLNLVPFNLNIASLYTMLLHLLIGTILGKKLLSKLNRKYYCYQRSGKVAVSVDKILPQ